MKEIRWHGRGGNGGFTSARLLGYAASLHGGKYAQAFPSFGPERRGAPVLGFTRIDDTPICDHSQVYECDCVIVLDESLINDINVAEGLKKGAPILINSTKKPEEFKAMPKFAGVDNIYTIDATSIALENLGGNIVNTIMLGAAVGVLDFVNIDDVEASINEYMAPALREKNVKVTRMAYEEIKGGRA